MYKIQLNRPNFSLFSSTVFLNLCFIIIQINPNADLNMPTGFRLSKLTEAQ